MSQITAFALGGGASSITSISGNSGGAQSGPAITISGGTSGATFTGAANTLTLSFNALNLPTTASASVGTININSTRVLHSFGTNNIFLGSGSGNFTLTSVNNVGVGVGTFAALSTDPGGNVAVGFNALHALNNGANGGNNAVGQNSMLSATTAGSCNAFGLNSLVSLLSGNFCLALGHTAGSAYTGAESHNISLNATGTVGESNTLRIGAATGTGNQQLNRAFISGINGITVTGVAVLVSAADQLGIAVSSERYKEAIKDMDDYSDEIYELRCVTFNYKQEPNAEYKSVGLVAEEVEDIMPQLIHRDKEGLPMSVKYLDLIPMLLNEVQKLRKELNGLKEVKYGSKK